MESNIFNSLYVYPMAQWVACYPCAQENVSLDLTSFQRMMNEWMDGWMDKWMNGLMYTACVCPCKLQLMYKISMKNIIRLQIYIVYLDCSQSNLQG